MSGTTARKRLLIDASVVNAVNDGLSTYIVNLLKYLPDAAFDAFEISVLRSPGLDRADFAQAVAGRPYTMIEDSIAPIGPRRDWQMFRFLRRHRRDFDLVHITSNNYPLWLKGGICTIHDVTFRREFHTAGGRPGTGAAAVAYMSNVIRTALRRSRLIIADSEATRQDLRAEFGVPAERMRKIEVVHLGWEHLLDGPAGPDDDASLYPGRRFMFFLGSFRPHKNLARLLEAWRQALADLPNDLILVVSGSRSDNLAPALQAVVAEINSGRERVVFTGYLSNADVDRHYRQAEAFIFPSTSEGFGIPVLEAFHHGVPLLCSDRSSLAEVAGGAALSFDPFDPGAIADTIRAYCHDPALRETLIAKGKARLADFSWAKTGRETLAIYCREAGIAPPTH